MYDVLVAQTAIGAVGSTALLDREWHAVQESLILSLRAALDSLPQTGLHG